MGHPTVPGLAYALHSARAMNRIVDALEFLTAQHESIEALLAELITPTMPVARRQVVGTLARTLTLHLAIEQALLYPVAASISAEVRAELGAEHHEIKRILAELVWLEVDDPRFVPTLELLQILIGWHAGWQEAQLFEALAESLTAAEHAALGARLHAWLDHGAAIATAA